MRRFSIHEWLMMSAIGVGCAASATAAEPSSPSTRRAARAEKVQLVSCTNDTACAPGTGAGAGTGACIGDPGCAGIVGDCAGSNCGCGGSGCSKCGGGMFAGCGLLSGELGDPWTVTSLFEDECGGNPFTDNGWIMGGFTQFGYQDAPDGAFAGNGPFVSQKEYNTFALNQQYMYLGKVADGSKGLDWGFRADLMFGLDGNEGQAFGNINAGHYDYLNGWDHGPYEWALPQLYAEMAYEDLSVKVGHFYTNIGYEVIPSNGNFFLSRQLTFYNSEPFTHTGALATYKVSDKLTVQGGWTLGMDTGFYQYQGSNSFLGGLTYAIDDDTSLIYGMTVGNLGWRGDGSINSIILTRKWAEKFSTVHQFDVLSSNLNSDFNANPTAPAPPAGAGIASNSTGLINYAFYDINDKLKAGARYEWYKADGTSYQTLTGGVNIKPMSNLVIRPEVRYMFSEGNQQIYTGPGYSGELFNQTVFGIDAILTY